MKRLIAVVALVAGTVAWGRPSPSACVRACPEGAASAKRLWNGISPLVKAWELGERDKTRARLGGSDLGRLPDETFEDRGVVCTNAGIRIEVACTRPEGADAQRPAPVFLLNETQGAVPTNSIAARGYALVRWRMDAADVPGVSAADRRAWVHARALDWIGTRPELDATRVAVVGDADGGRCALRAGALDERFALTVACGVDGDGVADLVRLVAPRLVYRVGGTEKVRTDWAAARDLYRAYGLEERMGEHGGADARALRPEDWEKVMDFADRRLKDVDDADSRAIEARVAAACRDGTRAVALGWNAAAPDGVWRLARAILVPDDFTLVFDGCRVELADGVQDNLVRNAGAAEGTGTPNRGLRILGRNGAVLSGGRRNHYLPRRSGDPNGWRSVGILLCDVSDYEVGGFAMEETQCWAISQERCCRGRVHDIRFGSTDIMFNQDGVDVRKGCHDLVIENISGSTGDDAVALTAYHNPKGTPPKYGMQIGGNDDLGAADDVYNVTIRNVHAKSAGGHGVIRLLVCDGIRMHHISVEDVVDTAQGQDRRPQATIRLGDRAFHRIRPCAMGEMHHVTVRNVKASGKIAVWVKGPMQDSEITGVTVPVGGRKYDVTAPTERVVLDKD